MEKIKVIELLNMIANKQEVPTVIKLPPVFKEEYRYAYWKWGCYHFKDDIVLSFETDYLSLNDKVGIVKNLNKRNKEEKALLDTYYLEGDDE